MKRPVQPVHEYLEHERYPAVDVEDEDDVALGGEGVSRRDFLGQAVVASAATAGVMTLGSEALAAPRDKDTRQKVSLYLGRLRVGNSQMSVQRIVVFTGDKKLAHWMRRYQNRSGITRAVSPVLRKTKADVLLDGKKLYRLERKIGAAVARYYRKKTGKATGQPDLMLVVGRYWRPRMMGRMVRPHFRPTP